MDNPKNSPKFDLSKISKVDRELLASTFLDAVLEFYSNPENESRFQEWLREKHMKDET